MHWGHNYQKYFYDNCVAQFLRNGVQKYDLMVFTSAGRIKTRKIKNDSHERVNRAVTSPCHENEKVNPWYGKKSLLMRLLKYKQAIRVCKPEG